MAGRSRLMDTTPNTSSMLGFTLYAWAHLRRQLSGVLVLMLLASLTEGVSLLLLVPILKLINPTHPFRAPRGANRPAGAVARPTADAEPGAVLIVFVAAITLRGAADAAQGHRHRGLSLRSRQPAARRAVQGDRRRALAASRPS